MVFLSFFISLFLTLTKSLVPCTYLNLFSSFSLSLILFFHCHPFHPNLTLAMSPSHPNTLLHPPFVIIISDRLIKFNEISRRQKFCHVFSFSVCPYFFEFFYLGSQLSTFCLCLLLFSDPPPFLCFLCVSMSLSPPLCARLSLCRVCFRPSLEEYNVLKF